MGLHRPEDDGFNINVTTVDPATGVTDAQHFDTYNARATTMRTLVSPTGFMAHMASPTLGPLSASRQSGLSTTQAGCFLQYLGPDDAQDVGEASSHDNDLGGYRSNYSDKNCGYYTMGGYFLAGSGSSPVQATPGPATLIAFNIGIAGVLRQRRWA